MAAGSSVCVMPSTLAGKIPPRWFNIAVTSRANSDRDLHLDLRAMIEPGSRTAREQLITALREGIRSGRLGTDTRLPPSRALASDLGLARNTVAEAYAELVAEGWLASRQGAGTWVARATAPGPAPRPRRIPAVPRHNLMPGSPDVSEFPRSAWLASARRAITDAPVSALRMGDPRGPVALREALTEYLGRVRGVRTTPESIVICSGVRDGVDLLGRVLGTQRPIAVEAYGLFIFRDALASLGVPTTPIGVDAHGAVISDLDRLDTPAVLLTPAHQSPFGMALHPARRTAVIDWAQRTGGYAVDDDYDGEFRYDRQPVGALQSLNPERVVYLGFGQQEHGPGDAGGLDGAARRIDRSGHRGGRRGAVPRRRAHRADPGRLHPQRRLRPAHPADAQPLSAATRHPRRRTGRVRPSASAGWPRASTCC